MIAPTAQQADLFARLVHTQVHVFFKDSLEKCRDMLETQQDSQVIHKIQGEAFALRAILKLIDPTGKQA